MLNARKLYLVGTGLALITEALVGQMPGYPYEIDQYPFIHYDKNQIKFYDDSVSFEQLFSKFDSVHFYGQGQINIVHLGGSHLQADIYTHQLRKRLQTFMPGSNGGRGLVFPYRIAQTNNPGNYKITYNGEWDYSKNTKRRLEGPLGLMGIKVVTSDTNSSIHLSPNAGSEVKYDFNKVRVFHSFDLTSLVPVLETDVNIIGKQVCPEYGYTEFRFQKHTDTLNLYLNQSDSLQRSFELYGIQLMTDDPGFVYHAVGVNGASLPSFSNCELFVNHMKAVNPDLVIISIGTNDGNTRWFKPDDYRQNYDTLIYLIREAVPGAALLLTVPNDSYLHRRYVNKNTAKIEKEIFHLAKKYEAGVWDLYQIMGGLNSIYVWYKEGLARRDKIHFTRKGYELKGDLLFNALLKAYDNHLNPIITEKNKKYSSAPPFHVRDYNPNKKNKTFIGSETSLEN